MKKGYISNPVISRMPRYYRCIDELYHEKCVRVSSAVLAIQNSIIIVGCGNLGHALLNNFDFQACGMTLVGAFDKSPELIGQKIGAYVVESLDQMPEIMEHYHPEIAVLCVPRNYAQTVAEQLVSMGIRGIWNFTNHELNLPGQVKVENVVFQDSLLLLGYKINEGGES